MPNETPVKEAHYTRYYEAHTLPRQIRKEKYRWLLKFPFVAASCAATYQKLGEQHSGCCKRCDTTSQPEKRGNSEMCTDPAFRGFRRCL